MSEIDVKPSTPLLQWTDEDVIHILKQYDRKPEDLKTDVAIIRDWLKTQPHLPLQPSDRQIVYFLLLNKFSFEKTKKKLEMNYTIKSIVPELITLSPNDPRIEQAINSYYIFPFSQLTKNGNRILISSCQNPDTYNIRHFFNQFSLLSELRTIYDICNSDEYIVDMKNINMTFMSKVNIVDLKKGIALWENVYSARVAALHVVNLPKVAANLLDLVFSLMKEKLQERVFYHKSMEELWEFYPKDILPKEYGGTKALDDIKREWLDLYKEKSDYLDKIQKARIVTELRPQQLENDEILGFHGNFRKLQID